MNSLKSKYESWVGTLNKYKRDHVFVWLAPGGLGDKLTFLPAFRHLKTMYPDKRIILFTEYNNFELWKGCRYIDHFIPEDCIKGPDALGITTEDVAIKAWWSFFDHHQKHVVKSSVEYICNTTFEDGIPLEYELDIFEYEREEIKKYQTELTDLAKGKKIAVIAPAFTMYSRMWPIDQWTKLVELLKKKNYFVVSAGSKTDHKINNVDLDVRSKYPIRQIPHILNVVDVVFTVSSGMLHLAAVNQDVPIVYISVGQFPPELLTPYRRGSMSHNMLVVNHDCELKKQCFDQHIREVGINKEIEKFLNTWKNETNTEFDQSDGLLQKYACWFYCSKVLKKYSCGRNLKPKKVFDEFMNWRKNET